MDRLLLIDTFYFLHRSFYAYPKDLTNSKGQHTNMVFGLAQTLLDSISEFNPSHIACGWESEEKPSFRKELYPDYQKTRKEMEPEDHRIFKSQLPLAIELLEAFNIPRLMENGFEGDDVIGTAASKASEKIPVVITTADQDMLQLIEDNIQVFRPGRPPFVSKMLFNAERFEDKYGFKPEQMIDYKALRGDPSDNIPGVKGIGDKNATKLLQQFGTLENIYESIEEVKTEAIKRKLIEDKENAFLSKELATIITNIPMPFELDDCLVHDFNPTDIRSLFDELGFNSLNKKLEKLIKIKGIKDELNKSANQQSFF